MEAKRFVIDSICGTNPINRGFFVPLDEKTQCHHCKDTFFVMHPTTQGRYWCAQCYIKTYCNVDKLNDGFIIRQKNSSKILFQHPPIIENVGSAGQSEIHN